ncbi:MAG: STAS domain-containing protein [Bacillota bacterium]
MLGMNHKGNNLIVRLGEELNYFNSTATKEQIKQQVAEDTEQIILSLTEVKRMDSSGVGVIISLIKFMEGKKVVLVDPQPKIARIFEITRLDQIIEIYPTLDEALIE